MRNASMTAPTVMAVLYAISFSHLLNDTIQALLPSIYPMLRDSFHLDFAQLGWITFTFQCTSSLFQPVVGFVTDKRPMPHSLAVGMGLSFSGLIALAFAPNYPLVLLSAATLGLGSAVFHPEASRVAHMAAGVHRGFAQSLFQLGGNTGTSLGPLLAALIVVSHGRGYLAWFALLALLGMENIHAMNGMKTLLVSVVNGVALAIFVWSKVVVWPQALLMLVGATIGGYGGAYVAQKIDPKYVRRLVIFVGFAMSAYFFIREWM